MSVPFYSSPSVCLVEFIKPLKDICHGSEKCHAGVLKCNIFPPFMCYSMHLFI